MNNLQIFSNNEFGEIRTVEIDGNPYFVANDVANALGYSNPRKAIIDHCKGVTKRDTPTSSGVQSMSYINEGDLYRLIMKSKLPSAEKFEKWVMEDILPSIRKNGVDSREGKLGKGTRSDMEMVLNINLETGEIRMVSVYRDTYVKIDEKNKLIAIQDSRIQEMRPKEIFADAVSTSHTSILIGDLAKLICQNGYQIGQKRLFEWLRENNFLIKNGASRNMPMQRYVEQGLFEVKESSVQNPDGSVRITRTTKVTGKGQIYFVNKFIERSSHERTEEN